MNQCGAGDPDMQESRTRDVTRLIAFALFVNSNTNKLPPPHLVIACKYLPILNIPETLRNVCIRRFTFVNK